MRRKTSIVKTPLTRSAEYVTPQRIGGRVAPTKSGSAVSPTLRSLTALRPRTCRAPRSRSAVAPKEIAIPKIAAMHQPQEIRFAIAMAPSTMTRMTRPG